MRRLQRFIPSHIRNFLALEAAGGIVMIAAAMLAIMLANSPLATTYQHILQLPVAAGMDLSLFTKDVLMAIFFFAVGLELKYEMREGALSQPGQKILPAIAALGGIILPALLYLLITREHPEYRAGWAIPTATDIAFALCVLRLAGPHIPAPAKIFLLAIAIYDDLAAILIIALVYSSTLAILPLLQVLTVCLALYAFNRAHITRIWPYILLGALLWYALHHAGIHPTIAGVITAIAIPLRTRNKLPLLTPLLHRLHPYVAFFILPLFAFCSTGIALDMPLAQLTSALPVGIALALFLGKQFGIFAATFACVKCGLASLPANITWRTTYGIAILAGIGFTMSLFIGQLAFPQHMQEWVTLGVLGGSLLSALFGSIFLVARRTP